jgi:hypothetical protein
MANPSNPHGFIAEFIFGNGGIPLWQGVIKSAAALTDGDPLYATVGLINRFDNTTTSAGQKKGILGVAAETKTAASTVRDTLLFVPALETIVFSGQYGSATSVQFTQGLIFNRARVLGTGTGKMRLTAASTPTFGQVNIIGLKKTSAFGTFGEAMFIFTKSTFTGRQANTMAIT